MKYLDPKFTVPSPEKVMPGTCGKCVYGVGHHVDGCSERGAEILLADEMCPFGEAEWQRFCDYLFQKKHRSSRPS